MTVLLLIIFKSPAEGKHLSRDFHAFLYTTPEVIALDVRSMVLKKNSLRKKEETGLKEWGGGGEKDKG